LPLRKAFCRERLLGSVFPNCRDRSIAGMMRRGCSRSRNLPERIGGGSRRVSVRADENLIRALAEKHVEVIEQKRHSPEELRKPKFLRAVANPAQVAGRVMTDILCSITSKCSANGRG